MAGRSMTTRVVSSCNDRRYSTKALSASVRDTFLTFRKYRYFPGGQRACVLQKVYFPTFFLVSFDCRDMAAKHPQSDNCYLIPGVLKAKSQRDLLTNKGFR